MGLKQPNSHEAGRFDTGLSTNKHPRAQVSSEYPRSYTAVCPLPNIMSLKDHPFGYDISQAIDEMVLDAYKATLCCVVNLAFGDYWGC